MPPGTLGPDSANVIGAVPPVHLPVTEKLWPAVGAEGLADSVQPVGTPAVGGVVVVQLTVMSTLPPLTLAFVAVQPGPRA